MSLLERCPIEKATYPLSNGTRINHFQLDQFDLEEAIAIRIPETLARRHQMIAMGYRQNQLVIVMHNPNNLFALEDLRWHTKEAIIPLQGTAEEIKYLTNKIYASAHTSQLINQIEERISQVESTNLEIATADVPLLQLIHNMLERCILNQASDMHIEASVEAIRFRYRIDGVLYEMNRLKKEALEDLMRCLKLLGDMDSTESRKPQDGRFTKKVGAIEVDLRVSIIPSIYGERAVVRFIYATTHTLKLEEMGFYPSDYEKVLWLMKQPSGLILLTGPTGSGKSTTLSAILRVLNDESMNLMTIEDPVEHRIKGISQVAINPKINLDFEPLLRAILRQDPDILMIGEIRDPSTSHLAIRAALTGHLILSTLHTSDAVGAVARLIEMGNPDYLVGATVKGVVAQRLLRRLCDHCKIPYSLSDQEARQYGLPIQSNIYQAGKCTRCQGTGYNGRLAIHEVFIVDKVLEEKMASGLYHGHELKQVARAQGMRTLYENGTYQVLQGSTSLEEFARLCCDLG